MKISSNIIKTTIFFICTIFVLSCQKKEQEFSEPYGPGKNPLGIKIDPSQVPSPSFGLPGSSVLVNATGLIPFKDKLILRFNGEEAEVEEITETGIKVKVADYASTGVISISIDDIVIFGPQFTVTGKVNLDPTFRVSKGTNGDVTQVLETTDGKRIVVGGFTNYDNKGIIRPINRIARTFPDGTYDASFRSGKGANGYIGTIIQQSDKYFIGGAFVGYDQRTENISNITRLNSNGTIDTMAMKTFRRPDQADTIKYFPAFNGGFDQSVGEIYEQQDKLIVTGGFRYYVTRIYDKANKLETRDTVILDSTEVRQIARLNKNGSLDKSYRFNTAANKSLTGGNGYIGTYMHKEGAQEGKMLVFGSFTKFDDQDNRYLLRLNQNGTIDNTFNPSGLGADSRVSVGNYNPITKQYLIVGDFINYNGEPVKQIALLNEDGTLDQSFRPKEFVGGYPYFAKQLNDGLIVVGGSFKTYNGIARNGFMVLESTGKLAIGYNATGIFDGNLYDVVETESEDGKRALLLMGSFYRFNGEPANNIVRVTLE